TAIQSAGWRFGRALYTPFASSGNRQWDNGYHICDYLQAVLRALKDTLLFLWSVVRAGSLPGLWERYVMTETFSLLVYVLVLYWSLLYLQNRRIWQLAVVQALFVVLISFRMGYLLVVQVCTLLLPVIAFAPYALFALRDRSNTRVSRLRPLRAAGAH